MGTNKMGDGNRPSGQPGDFEAIKERLEQIAKAVDDENMPLDDALDLYEEAVKLGLQASSLLEASIVVDEPEADAAAPEADAAPAADASAAGHATVGNAG